MLERPSEAVLDAFAEIVGTAYALRETDAVAPFVTDPRDLFSGQTPLVLRPGSVEEVSRILRLATETKTAIVPQGGNTGLVGGQLPDAGRTEIVLSLGRLDRIREIDLRSGVIVAETGVILQRLREIADAQDKLFPLSLGSQGSCQIGGNLSSNAGGTSVLAYGNARDLCLGLEVVLPTGEVFDDLRKLRKDNTGYDLKNLFIGAEGTLGVITAAVLKLFPKPRGRETIWLGVASPEDALALFEIASSTAAGALTCFELMQECVVDFVIKHMHGHRAPLASPAPWHVLVEISSGRSADDARGLAEEIVAAGFERGLILDGTMAESLAQTAEFWRMRESMTEAQRPEGASIKHDISVPVADIPRFIEEAGRAVASVCPDARVVCFGHMGDGNLHYNATQPAGAFDASFLDLYPTMNKAVHDVVRSLSGSISAEHGIGRMKRQELLETAPPVALDLMRRLKAIFDPAGIMNPGKVI